MAAMFETLAKAFVYALETYAGLGVIFAASFVCFGVQRLDPAAQGSGIAFRLLILPGVTALWPMILYRWRRAAVQFRARNHTND
jgi:hypothetical protein